LTNSTFLCDSGEAPFFNYSDEHLHGIEFVHSSLRIPLGNGCYARKNDSFRLIQIETTQTKGRFLFRAMHSHWE
jgi:hypothetical protein